MFFFFLFPYSYLILIFGTEIHSFIFNKDTAWLRIYYTACVASHGYLVHIFLLTSRL